MSRGLGRVARIIKELFANNPDLAFAVPDLVDHCYPGTADADNAALRSPPRRGEPRRGRADRDLKQDESDKCDAAVTTLNKDRMKNMQELSITEIENAAGPNYAAPVTY